MKKILYVKNQNGRDVPVYPEEIKELEKRKLLPKEWKDNMETKNEKKTTKQNASVITSKSINES